MEELLWTYRSQRCKSQLCKWNTLLLLWRRIQSRWILGCLQRLQSWWNWSTTKWVVKCYRRQRRRCWRVCRKQLNLQELRNLYKVLTELLHHHFSGHYYLQWFFLYHDKTIHYLYRFPQSYKGKQLDHLFNFLMFVHWHDYSSSYYRNEPHWILRYPRLRKFNFFQRKTHRFRSTMVQRYWISNCHCYACLRFLTHNWFRSGIFDSETL